MPDAGAMLKLEDLPGCAVLVGSVGGHIGCPEVRRAHYQEPGTLGWGVIVYLFLLRLNR